MSERASLYLFKALSVGDDCLIFKISDEAMACFRGEHVGESIPPVECTLTQNDKCAERERRLLVVKKSKEMHAFVLSLLEQMMDPSSIIFERSQRSQMAHHPSDHAWYSCHCFEKDDAIEPLPFFHARLVAR